MWVGSLISWVAFASLFGSTFLLPQYLQVLRGLSSFQAGLLLAPQGLASMVGTIVVGVLYSRLGARPLVIMGAIAVALATYLMSQWLSLTSLFAELIPLLLVLGFGLPFLLQATSTAALTGIEGPTLPGANTLLSVSRSAVSSLAVAELVNLVQAQRLVHQAALAHHMGASERGRSPTGTSSGLSGCVSALCSNHAPHPGARVVPEDAASHSEERGDNHIWRESTDPRSSNWISIRRVSILCGAIHIRRPCVKEQGGLPQSR